MKQDCSKRNLVYQTYCITCKERDAARMEAEAAEDHKKKNENIKNMKLSKYIDETSRSCFQRAQEHQNDMKQLKTSSHMFRYALDKHEGEELGRRRFGMEMNTILGDKEFKNYEKELEEAKLKEEDLEKRKR